MVKDRDWDRTMNIGDALGDVLEEAADPRDRAYLIVLTGTSVGEMFKLDRDGMVIGRTDLADIRVQDEGVSRRHARVRIEDDAILIEDLNSRNGTYCNGGKVERHVLQDGDKVRVGRTTILKFTYQDDLDESFTQQMYNSALRDGLTQAFNKRFILDRLDGEFSFAKRHKTPLSIVMMDLDHFKQVNDTHGHIAGDSVLISLATCISEQIRNEDVFARYGGEEFIVVCRATAQEMAAVFADRLRRTIEELVVDHEGTPIQFTASFGIAGMPDVEATSPTDLLEAADRALYAAKAGGRNRIVVSGNE